MNIRLVIDYRQLNKITLKDSFSFPNMKVLLLYLKEAKIFSKLDMANGYHQIKIFDPDIYKTALSLLTHTMNIEGLYLA